MTHAALGFPAWIRATHWINVLFIGFMIRAGIQILAAYPRLYWNVHCTPGTE
jgi:methionine sulfoxide reductase catalytic subunit